MVSGVLTVLGFMGLLVSIVVIHEAGHFFMAKLFKVKVLEFGIGFPPRLASITRGETRYSINLIPLGGFCKMLGEEDPSQTGSLSGKSPGIRFLILAAGPFMNLILAVVLFSLLFLIPHSVPVGDVLVKDVIEDSPAWTGGVLPGDLILEANGRALDTDLDLRYQIALSDGEEMTWLILRADNKLVVKVVPRIKPPEGEGATGIRVITQNIEFMERSVGLPRALILGINQTGQILVLAKNEIGNWFSAGRAPEVAGPVGMAQVFGEVAQVEGISLKDRALTTISLAALISLSLSIFNFLPIPALDGGRILFVGIEWIRRGKRIPPQKEGLVHLFGFALLITLAIIITLEDIGRLLRGESFLGG